MTVLLIRMVQDQLAVLDEFRYQLEDLDHLEIEVRAEIGGVVLGEMDVVVGFDRDDPHSRARQSWTLCSANAGAST